MRWIPLESNPQIMNEYTSQLGLDTSKVAFTDVFSFDDELLAMVPQPVYATVLLFPVTLEYEKAKREQAERIEREGQEGKLDDLIYIKQTIGNACGTMGLLHALANSSAPIGPSTPLAELFEKCKGKTPVERAQLLENDTSLETAHGTAANGGQTTAPAADSKVDLHFVAFVEHNGRLVELDGGKSVPIDHGPIRESLLHESARVARDVYLPLAGDSLEFSLIALANAE